MRKGERARVVSDGRDADVRSSRSCVALFCCPPRQVDETGTDGEVHRERTGARR